MGKAAATYRVDHVLDSFLRRIAAVRGDVIGLYLYGSRARGTHQPDSDYDVFVVLRERSQITVDALYDGVVDVICETGSLISLKIVSRETFERLVAAGNPLVANVLHDGVELAFPRSLSECDRLLGNGRDGPKKAPTGGGFWGARKQLIEAYMDKARQKLGVARRLRDSRDHEDAVSRAYYAAFHAVKALLASAGEQPRTHHGAVTLFNLLFVKTEKMSKRTGRFFANLKDDRESADYELFSYADADTARLAVEEAQSIITEAASYLEGLAGE